MSCLSQKRTDPPPPVATSNEECLRSLRQSWAQPYSQSAFLKDLPRLVRRVQVQTRSGALLSPAAEREGKLEAVAALLEVVAREVGSEADLQAATHIRRALDRSPDSMPESEDEAVASMLRQLDPEGSVIRALKLINQGTVLYAMSILKEEVLRDSMVKDVRTPQGWQIILRLGDVVQLEHVRTEQSIDEFGDDTNHFEIQWMIMVTFDGALEQLRSCSIRLLRLSPSPDMEPDKLRHLRNTLIEGLIIL